MGTRRNCGQNRPRNGAAERASPSIGSDPPLETCGVLASGENERLFPLGSAFSFGLAGKPADTAIVRVAIGARLRIAAASMSFTKKCLVRSDSSVTLMFGSEENEDLLPLCPFKDEGVFTGLGIECVGPRTIKLQVRCEDIVTNFKVSVFGSVLRDENGRAGVVEDRGVAPVNSEILSIEQIDERSVDQDSKKRKVESDNITEDKEDVVPRHDEKRGDSNTEHCHPTPSPNHSLGIVDAETTKNVTDANKVEASGSQHLSKKQRKKLAKQKAKELADAIASDLGHGDRNADAEVSAPRKKQKCVPLTKSRRLPTGVTVKDLILGDGIPVKPGRKVSILYEGSFPDTGKVFDKNQNRRNPLSFRLGTGEVIRGLECGMEGMRVGGERIVTIPPELGYGKKGSGSVVPGNSTLVFNIQLLSVGGRL